MMRKMGLDIGDKRIGIAVSDELNLTAQGKEVLERGEHREDLAKIKQYIKKYDISEIVVGLPKNMDNTEGARVEKTKNYVNFLKNNLELDVIFWDERLTSKVAEKTLIEADLTRERRREVIDQVAAVLILQNYLDYERKKSKREEENMSEQEGTFWIDEETEELVLQEGEEEERFYVEREMELDGENYLILIPSEKGKYEEGEALVLKLTKDDDSEVLSIIESEDEFEKVKNAYLEEE